MHNLRSLFRHLSFSFLPLLAIILQFQAQEVFAWTISSRSNLPLNMKNEIQQLKAGEIAYFQTLADPGWFAYSTPSLAPLDSFSVGQQGGSKMFVQHFITKMPFSITQIDTQQQAALSYLQLTMSPLIVSPLNNQPRSVWVERPGAFGQSYRLTSEVLLSDTQELPSYFSLQEKKAYKHLQQLIEEWKKSLGNQLSDSQNELEQIHLVYRKVDQFSAYAINGVSWTVHLPLKSGETIVWSLSLSAVKRRFAFGRILFPNAIDDTLLQMSKVQSYWQNQY
jgi:hypothetical protein